MLGIDNKTNKNHRDSLSIAHTKYYCTHSEIHADRLFLVWIILYANDSVYINLPWGFCVRHTGIY